VTKSIGRRSIAVATVAAAALGLGAAAASGATPTKGGTVVFGQQTPPDCLGPMLTDCNSLYAQRLVSSGMVLSNLLTASAAGRYIPDLATRVPTGSDVSLKNGVLSVTFNIEPSAKWADGKNFTADDVIFTWKIITNDKYSIASRIGWRDVASIKKSGPKKFTVTFKKGKTVAGWKDMFSAAGGFVILPKHVLQGKDYNTVWNNGGFDSGTPIVGIGPYQLKSYSEEQATLAPNPRYWGKNIRAKGGPFLDSIVAKSGLGSAGVITGIKSGELNLVAPQPDFGFINQIPGTPGVSVQIKPAYSTEHIAFNTQAVPLTDPAVRKAIAYALDRQGVVSGLLNNQVPLLNSGPALVPATKGYIPAFAKYTYNPAQAASILQAAGYQKGSDGIFAKGGQRVSIKVLFTPSQVQRRNNLNYLASKAQAAGIELIPTPDANIFVDMPRGQFEAAEFGWIGGADPSQTQQLDVDAVPTEANEFAGSNYYRYTGASTLARKTDYAVSDATKVPAGAPFGGPARAKALIKLQQKLADDVPFVPLYVSPNTLAAKQTLVGPKVSLTLIHPFWNTQIWNFKGGKA
jgi:peptide/nickel transport system substrate-binding protein